MVVAERKSAFLDDAASLRAIIEQMPDPRLRQEYESYKALHLESTFPNRKMVVYTLMDGYPERCSELIFGDLTMTRIGGPVVSISYEREEVEVGVSPVKIGDRDLFFQIPQHFELKWSGKLTNRGRVEFVPHYAVLVKTRSKEFQQVDGDTYAPTLNKFRERFPSLDMRF